MSPPEVVVLRRGQERAAAAAIAASHADYPSFRHVFPDAAQRARALPPFFAATIRDAVGFGAVRAAIDGPTVLGVAVWLPPGAFPWTPWRKARATGAFLRVFAAAPASFRTFMRYGANSEHAHPRDPHWYLVVLGIRPDAQRLGLGSRLMEAALAQADRDGVACRLETADGANVAYYQRFGFEVTDDALPLVPGGPTHVAMHRPARA